MPRSVDLGGFSVRRALPHSKRRMVGPFIFFDHFGPAEFKTGQGIDVRPHPHIGLATVTFLFDGEIMHRDSLGTAVAIRPGEVNWMTAGRGIVHSERTAPERRPAASRCMGCNVGSRCPRRRGDRAGFRACRRPTLPDCRSTMASRAHRRGLALRRALACADIVRYAVRRGDAAAGTTLPFDATTEERALYVVAGEIDIMGDRFAPGRLLIFRPGDASRDAPSDARVVLVGGAAMDGPRHIWWNFVSSRKDRIEQAKADWKAGRFSIVPGDENEFIPLPE